MDAMGRSVFESYNERVENAKQICEDLDWLLGELENLKNIM